MTKISKAYLIEKVQEKIDHLNYMINSVDYNDKRLERWEYAMAELSNVLKMIKLL